MYVKKKRAKQEKERTPRLHTTNWRVYKMQKRHIIAITFYQILYTKVNIRIVPYINTSVFRPGIVSGNAIEKKLNWLRYD